MHTKFISGLILSLLMFLTACGTSPPAQPVVENSGKPTARIISPASNSEVNVGETVVIEYNAADVSGIRQVEVSVNGAVITTRQIEPAFNTLSQTVNWQADSPGDKLLELRVFNIAGQSSDVAQVLLTVVGSAATATSPPGDSGAVQATPTEVAFQAVDTPTPTPTSEVIAEQPTATLTPEPTTANTPRLTIVSAALFVRGGPGTNFDAVGKLSQGDTVIITGRDEFTNWWQIIYPPQTGERVWVSAASEFTLAENSANVPQVEVNVATNPTVSPATATAVPPTATPQTADSNLPEIYYFEADKTEVAAGEEVTLRWDLGGANVAVLRYNTSEDGVVAPGEQVVKPERDTLYTLAAINDEGETTRQIQVTIKETEPTPVPVRRQGQLDLQNGQGVDFDRGTVGDRDQAGIDFVWDANAVRFFPISGAEGALLNTDYGEVDFPLCLDVPYNQPVSGVTDPRQIGGCFITSESVYGKFRITSFDFSGRLTIEWLTWQY